MSSLSKSQAQLPSIIQQLNSDGDEKYIAMKQIIDLSTQIPEIAQILWYSSTTMTNLLSNLLSFYSLLGCPTSKQTMTNITSTLRLFYIVAASPETKIPFVRTNIPIYLFPFVQLTYKSPDLEPITGATLAVLSVLVRESNPIIIQYLVSNDIITILKGVLTNCQLPLRSAAAYILLKILSDPDGKMSLLENEDQINLVVKAICKNVIALSKEFNTALSDYIVQSINILIQHSTIPPIFAHALGHSLDDINATSGYNGRYADAISKLRNITNEYIPKK